MAMPDWDNDGQQDPLDLGCTSSNRMVRNGYNFWTRLGLEPEQELPIYQETLALVLLLVPFPVQNLSQSLSVVTETLNPLISLVWRRSRSLSIVTGR
jgi:hypothetical protein